MILKQQMNLNVDSSSEDSSGKTAGNGAVTPASERLNEFLSTGRTGRRNAVTNINQNANTGTADLPEKLQALTTESDLGINFFPSINADDESWLNYYIPSTIYLC